MKIYEVCKTYCREYDGSTGVESITLCEDRPTAKTVVKDLADKNKDSVIIDTIYDFTADKNNCNGEFYFLKTMAGRENIDNCIFIRQRDLVKEAD